MQLKPQLVPSQVAALLAGGEQAVQEVPQVAGLVLAAHDEPHWWNPALQVKPQLVPSQVAVPPLGATQALHELPQSFTLVFESQVPAQSCVPLGQTPTQACAWPMQAPAQS